LRGSLPWQAVKISNKEERYRKICEIKKNTSIKDLCSGFPNELETILTYVRNLEFKQVPDYNYLKLLLKNILINNNSCIDFFYDWNREKPKIEKDNPIFTNNYNIIYNGGNEWLQRNDNSVYQNKTNGNIYNTGNEFLKNSRSNTIYYKPVININPVSAFKNYKKNTTINASTQPFRTAENSYNDSRIYESNYTSSKTNIFKKTSIYS
jgi:hypothetical protein